MTRKQKKELRQRQTARQLMGIDQLTDHGLKTPNGELVFYCIQPDNLSVLPTEEVRERVLALGNLLRTTNEMILMALDSRESFQHNQLWYRQRLEEESTPALRQLLRQDMAHLNNIQSSSASSREFAMAFRLDEKTANDPIQLAQIAKRIHGFGFQVRLAEEQDIKRILAVYYQQDVVTDHFPSYDGEEGAESLPQATTENGGKLNPAARDQWQPKDFLDLIAPTAAKFNTDSYILGGTYRCALALRSYPTGTEELALLRHLGEKSGVNLRIYIRKVTPAEENAILHNASNRSRMAGSSTDNLQQSITAQADLQDVVTLITTMQRNREPLIHCAVFLELSARDPDKLRTLKDEVMAELTRSKLGVDSILLRQQEGFRSVNPAGANVFGGLFERVLPATSVGNLYPFNYSGKTDPKGFYVGRDKYGSNIITDLDRRAEDKTTGSALILGNSGQGKSHLLKLLLCNLLESGKSVISLDPEHELEELAASLGGCFIDLMGGQYRINPLEPKLWDIEQEDDKDAPAPFRQKTLLSQHISFLKDFFRSYKDFSDKHIDAIELMLDKLYTRWDMTDQTDFAALSSQDYPVLSDLYAIIEDSYRNYKAEENPLYTKELLQEILLGLHSMCKGAESRFFNGHTNITTDRFLVFGVKGLLQSSRNVKDAMLFNVLSYLSNRLLTQGNTVATLDELHVWLSNKVVIEYIRNILKRARKRDSSLVLASQNLEDFLLPGVAELTKPLFAIPTHQFLFNAGAIDKRLYMDALQLEDSEFKLIRYPQRGTCLYKCGNERYLLEVHAPAHKARLFGTAGGK